MIRAWEKDLNLSYPSGGAGYLISPSLIKSCSPIEEMQTEAEDVTVGIWMRKNRIKLDESLELWPWFPLISISYYDFEKAEKKSSSSVKILFDNLKKEDLDFIKSKITLHYIRGENTMKGFWKIMQSLN